MDSRRDQRGRRTSQSSGGGAGGDRPVSSYASLASIPAPSYLSLGNDPPIPPRGGRGYQRGGGGSDDRSTSSYEYRGGGRDGSRGRGRSSFLRRGSGGRSYDNNQNSRGGFSSSVAEQRPESPSLDQKSVNSGYESGEISLSPKPSITHPRGGNFADDRIDLDDRRNAARGGAAGDGSSRYGDSSEFRGTRRGSACLDERPPYERTDVGGGRGGIFGGRGGRGRGRSGRGGRSEYEGRGRPGDGRDSFRSADGPNRDRDREFPPRDGPRDLPSGDREMGTRDFAPRERDLPPRDLPRDLPPRERDLPPRELSLRDVPQRDGQKDYSSRERNVPPRDLPLRDLSLHTRLRDSPPVRDTVSRDTLSRDLPQRGRMLRDGSRDSFRSLDDDRYQARPALGSNSYSSILKETDFRSEPPPQQEDRFGKRRLADLDFRPADQDHKRPPRPMDYEPRGRVLVPPHEARPIGPRDPPLEPIRETVKYDRNRMLFQGEQGQREPPREPIRESMMSDRDRPPFRGEQGSVSDDRQYRDRSQTVNDESLVGGPPPRDVHGGQRPSFHPNDERGRIGGPPSEGFRDEPPLRAIPSPLHSQPFRRSDISNDGQKDYPSGPDLRPKPCVDRPPSPRPVMNEPSLPIESGGRSPLPSTIVSREPHLVDYDGRSSPHHGPPFSERGSFAERNGGEKGFIRGRGGRGIRGRGGRGRGGEFGRPEFGRLGQGQSDEFGRNVPPHRWEGPERNFSSYQRESNNNEWSRRDEDPPVRPKFVPAKESRLGGYASLADQVPTFASMAQSSNPSKSEETDHETKGTETDEVSTTAVESQKVEEKPACPRPLSPPPEGSPSGVMKALVRLAELEASMEYAFARHMLLVKKRRELQSQYKVLETLPVGIEAIQEDLEKLQAAYHLYNIES